MGYFRIGLEFSRQFRSREQINRLHTLMSVSPATKDVYTGIVSRRLCFEFATAEAREKFKTFLIGYMNKQKTPPEQYKIIETQSE